MQFQAEAIAKLTAWKVFDPSDPNLPELILPNDDGFQLDPNWEVQSINYAYEWLGLGNAQFIYQTITKTEGGFKRGNNPVPVEDVEALIMALSHLHPTQMLLTGWDHFDDYPSWSIELIGVDGQRVIISSETNSNPTGAPWNVFYNGRLYAQYNGLLAEPLTKLFDDGARPLAATFYPEGARPTAFATAEWPRQVEIGFSGLLPIANAFTYHTDTTTGEVIGEVREGLAIDRLGPPTYLSLIRDDGTTVPCDIQKIPGIDTIHGTDTTTTFTKWELTCRPSDAVIGQTFHYRIHLELVKGLSRPTRLDGELRGVWDVESRFFLMPPSKEVLAALMANKAARDLLSDHVLAMVYYSAAGDSSGRPPHTFEGEAVFVGQTQISGMTVRYSIGTLFAVWDDQLSNWTLTREAVATMLDDISQRVLTRQVVEKNPDVILNLWYSEKVNDIARERGYFVRLKCLNGMTIELPQEGHPLWAFGFNVGWRWWTTLPIFMIVDDSVIKVGKETPPISEWGRLSPVELPDQLDAMEVAECSL